MSECSPASILVSPSAARRVAAARDWLLARRAADREAPLLLLLGRLQAAGDVLRPLLLDRPRVTALFNVGRSTLDLLAHERCRALLPRRELTVATPLVCQALLGRILSQQRGALSHFGQVAEGLGFARALLRTLNELRLHGIGPDRLRTLGTTAGDDLALLLGAYQDALESERLLDRAALLALATAQCARSPAAADDGPAAAIFLLDVPLQTPAEVALLRALRQGGAQLAAAVPRGDDRSLRAMDEAFGDPALDRDEALPASDAPALDRLQATLFCSGQTAARSPRGATAPADPERDPSVAIFSAPSADLECAEIARRILLLAEAGVVADRIAVLIRQPRPYAELLCEALARAGLPHYLAGAALRPDPAGRALLLLLRCALEKLSALRFAEYLSLGQLPRRPAVDHRGEQNGDDGRSDDQTRETDARPEDDEPAVGMVFVSPARWERLIGEAAVAAGGIERWRRRLAGLLAQLEARLQTFESLDEGPARAVRHDVEQLRLLRDFALPLLEELAALPEQATWGEWIDRLGALASHALSRPARVHDLLAELWPLATCHSISLQRVIYVLHDRLTDLPRRRPLQRYGQVFVGPIDEARGRCFEVVFVPGLAERIFPGKALQDPVLLDRAREALAGCQGSWPPLPTAADRRQQERLALRLALGAARSRLVLSYPRVDLATGQPRVPSFYFLEAVRAVEGVLPDFEHLVREATAACDSGSIHHPHPRVAAHAIDPQEFDLATLADAERADAGQPVGGWLAHLHQHPHLIPALRAHWKRGGAALTSQDGLLGPSGAALEQLAGDRLQARPHAVTSLERFARCPYQFYLHSVVRLRPSAGLGVPPEGALDPLTRGRLYHRVQFELFRALAVRGSLPVTSTGLAGALELLHEVLAAVASEQREVLSPAIETLWNEEIAALEVELRGWLQREADQPESQPLHWEYAFGLPRTERSDAASTEQPARVDRYQLRGAIDLVEQRADGRLRITDYKTGRPPRNLGGALAGGTRLQRVLYGLAYEALNPGTEAAEGRLYYCTPRGEFRQLSVQLDARLREQALRLLAFVDSAVTEGMLPAAPEPDCQGCDYVAVCGRDADRRWRNKARRARSPWLRQLQQLRRG